jgi:tetratricopeptide (TPR) repeat protein
MKATKRSRSSGTGWTGADHLERDEAKKADLTSEQTRRRELLSHDTLSKRDAMKLRLHLTKAQREVDEMKQRLQVWDAQEEMAKEKERQRLEDNPPPPKKKGRLGPETWKLKGAARPAWEVYDFDTRFVDVHIEAHKEAKIKATRCENLLLVYKGRFAEAAPDAARDYLGLLMQLGHISVEAKKYKTARAAWLECIELEGDNPVSTARESLMRMYLDLKRYDSAFRFGEQLADDSSVWIRYSFAVVAFQQKKPEAEEYMVRAIQANPFCAYYLAFYDTFNGVMEYTEDLAESEDEPQSSLEEAIEYCSSEQVPMWLDSKANLTLKNILVRAAQGNHSRLKASELEWSDRLVRIEEESDRIAKEAALREDEEEEESDDRADEDRSEDEEDVQEEERQRRKQKDRSEEDEGEDEEDHSDEDEEEVKVDVRMYAGMFRTAMEMLEESGQLGVMLQTILE